MDKNYGVIIYLKNTFILRRPDVAILADIIKILTFFIKTILKDSRKVKKKLKILYQNAIYACAS